MYDSDDIGHDALTFITSIMKGVANEKGGKLKSLKSGNSPF